MTIPTEVTSPDVYTGDGTTTDFPTSFKLLDESHVLVMLLPVGSSSEVEQQLNVDYTVIGVGEDTATVRYLTAPAAGDVTSLSLDVPLTQEVDYTNNDPFDAETTEEALDKGTQIDQQLAINNGLAMKFPTTDTGDKTLPPVSERADKLLGFDTNGEPVAVVTGRGQIQNPTQFIIADGVYDYLLPYEIFNSTDLWVQITGIDVFTFDFTVTDNLSPNRTLTFDPSFEIPRVVGEWCEVRYVGNALLTGQVADGAINSPDKIADGVITVPKIAPNSPHHDMRWDENGNAVAWLPFFVGDIHLSAGFVLWPGFLECNGAAISRTTYSALFAVIGETYGPGDGTTTFNIPDFRGRFPVGEGQGYTKPGGAIGTARTRGQSFGSEEYTLTESNIPQISAPGGAGNITDDTGSGGKPGGLRPDAGVIYGTAIPAPVDTTGPGIAVKVLIYHGVYT